VPIEVTLKLRIEVVLDTRFNFAVKPIPRVLLYPFGWSTWISLLLVGEHTLAELAEFLPYIFSEKVFKTSNDSVTPATGHPVLSLRHLFDRVANGMRTDAFGGKETKDFDSQDTVVVTTVLAKHGGSLSLGALSTAEKIYLQRIVKPEGPPV
jgi:hypothetical protein